MICHTALVLRRGLVHSKPARPTAKNRPERKNTEPKQSTGRVRSSPRSCSPRRERRLAVLVVDHVKRGAARVPAQREVYLSLVRREDAVHHRNVALPHLPLSKLLRVASGTWAAMGGKSKT